MDEPLYIDRLIVEVTRRCNMRCRHCLRGDSQRVDISDEVIDAIFRDIDSIYSITFTGGEPSLAVDKIERIFEEIHSRGIELQNFWLATNGKKYSQKLVDILQNEYECCNIHGDFTGGLALSIDDYHDKISERNENKYRDLEFYLYEKEWKKQKYMPELVNEGNAYWNGIGEKQVKINEKINVEIDEEIRTEGDIYINVFGDVLLECDLSYDSQEDHKIGNVLEKSLKEIILEHEG